MKILIIEPDQSTQSVVESVLIKNSSSHEFLFFKNIVESKPTFSEMNIDFLILSVNAGNITETKNQLTSVAKKLLLTKALLLLPDASLANHADYDMIKNFFKTADYIVKPLSIIRLS